jgi:3-methyladenine DNA glycosylase AlkD
MPRAPVQTKSKKPAGCLSPLEVIAHLEKRGSARVARDMAERFGIRTKLRMLGVPVGVMRDLGKKLGRDHDLAGALFATGVYEGQMMAAFVGQPEKLTTAQMNAWAKSFDNWGTCDTLCFHLFDRSPLAWACAKRWGAAKPEFVKRAGFALIASLALHDKKAEEERFVQLLPLIERGAVDKRNFVKKGVSWALRGIGKRGGKLRSEAAALATRLAASETPACAWVGRDVLRDLKTR